MKLAQLVEASYERDYPNGIPMVYIDAMRQVIGKKFGLSGSTVEFLGPGMGTKLPGWIEIAKYTDFGPEEWDLVQRIAPGVIKKAFKDFLGLDVQVSIDTYHTTRDQTTFNVELL